MCKWHCRSLKVIVDGNILYAIGLLFLALCTNNVIVFYRYDILPLYKISIHTIQCRTRQTEADRTRWKVLWESTTPRESYCGLPPQWGCAVNGTTVTAVLIDQSRSFMNLHIRYVHWIAARLRTQLRNLWVFVANTCHTYYLLEV